MDNRWEFPFKRKIERAIAVGVLATGLGGVPEIKSEGEDFKIEYSFVASAEAAERKRIPGSVTPAFQQEELQFYKYLLEQGPKAKEFQFELKMQGNLTAIGKSEERTIRGKGLQDILKRFPLLHEKNIVSLTIKLSKPDINTVMINLSLQDGKGQTSDREFRAPRVVRNTPEDANGE